MIKLSRGLLVVLALLLAVGGAAAQEKTKIVMMHWEGPDSPLQEGIARFMEQNPDIEVELIFASPFEEKILNMVAGNVDFDVLYVSQDVYLSWVNAGILMDITDLIAQDPDMGQPNFFLPIEADRSAVNGRWYGIGSSWSLFQVYYDRAVFEQSGLPPLPRRAADAMSWDDFVALARKLVSSDGEQITRYGLTRPTWWLVLKSLILSNNGHFLNDDGTHFVLTQPEALKVFEAIREGIHEARIFGGSLSQRTAAMSIQGSWTTGLTWANVDFDVDVGVLPAFVTPATYAQGHIHAIYARTKHPEEAWRLLKFLNSDEYLGLWVSRGVWLPTTMSMMTLDAFETYNDLNYMQPGYLEQAVTYLYEAGRARKMPVGWRDALHIFETNMSRVWNDGEAATTVLAEIVPLMDEALRVAQGR